MKRNSPSTVRPSVRAVMWMIAGAVLMSGLWLPILQFGWQIHDSPGVRYSAAMSSGRLISRIQSYAPGGSEAAKSDWIRVELDIQRFLLAERRLEAILKLRIPKKVWGELIGTKSLTKVWEKDEKSGRIQSKKEYEDDYLEVILIGSEHLLMQKITFSVKQLFDANRDVYETIDMSQQCNIYLDGYMSSFPEDSYWGTVLPSIETSNGISRLTEAGQYQFVLALDFSVSVGGDLGSKVVFVQGEDDPRSNRPLKVSLEILRDRSFVWFCYALGSVPVILGVLLLYIVLGNPRAEKPELHQLLIDAGAILFAILPLRTILVPSEVTVLTKLDFILSVAIMIITTSVILRFLMTQLNRPSAVSITEGHRDRTVEGLHSPST